MGVFSRVPGAQLIDRLILSDMARFFVYILGGFSALFIIITLFQLLNSITRHNIEWTVVANDVEALQLAPKEGLALINGTDGMLGMLVLAIADLREDPVLAEYAVPPARFAAHLDTLSIPLRTEFWATFLADVPERSRLHVADAAQRPAG